jgi:hypothetical protein
MPPNDALTLRRIEAQRRDAGGRPRSRSRSMPRHNEEVSLRKNCSKADRSGDGLFLGRQLLGMGLP